MKGPSFLGQAPMSGRGPLTSAISLLTGAMRSPMRRAAVPPTQAVDPDLRALRHGTATGSPASLDAANLTAERGTVTSPHRAIHLVARSRGHCRLCHRPHHRYLPTQVNRQAANAANCRNVQKGSNVAQALEVLALEAP